MSGRISRRVETGETLSTSVSNKSTSARRISRRVETKSHYFQDPYLT